MDDFVKTLFGEKQMELRVIIAGSRDFSDYEYLSETLTSFIKEHPERDIVIVSGMARGADKLGERFAIENNFAIRRFYAKWDKYGKSAGYIRNNEMLDFIQQPNCENAVIAFWDGRSKGTKHTIDNAKKRDIQTYVYIKDWEDFKWLDLLIR